MCVCVFFLGGSTGVCDPAGKRQEWASDAAGGIAAGSAATSGHKHTVGVAFVQTLIPLCA